jgi:hypothetical protein
MPVSRKGAITISEAGLLVKLLKKIPAAKNAITNKTPPISSHFHAKTRTIIIMNAGILCITKQINTSFASPSKQSSENNIMKRMARMARILGVQ